MKYRMKQKDIIYMKYLRNIDNSFWDCQDLKYFLGKKTLKIYQKYFNFYKNNLKMSHIIGKKG